MVLRSSESLGPRFSQDGVSLIEVMISSLVLMLVALSVLPLMLSSVANNRRGAEATVVGNFSSSQLDYLLQVPFDEGPLEIPPDAQDLVSVEHQMLPNEEGSVYLKPPNTAWSDGDAVGVTGVQWLKTTTVRQFSLNDLEPTVADNISELDNPLTGSTPPDFVHLKEIEVEIVGIRQAGPLGAGQQQTIKVLKAF